MAEEYYISFDTKSNPGKIEAIKVTIEPVTITDMEAPLRIDLPLHPLYRDLYDFCKNNSPDGN
jgi:hypothetical protein